MNRGDVVLVLEQGSPASKGRPCVVVQRSSILPTAAKVTMCPLTTRLKGPASHRPFVSPTEANGLRQPSEVEVDWIYTFRRHRLGPTIGRLDDDTMREVDGAIRRWLAL